MWAGVAGASLKAEFPRVTPRPDRRKRHMSARRLSQHGAVSVWRGHPYDHHGHGHAGRVSGIGMLSRRFRIHLLLE